MLHVQIVINKLCSFLEVTKWWRFYQWALNEYVKLWISLSLSLSPFPPPPPPKETVNSLSNNCLLMKIKIIMVFLIYFRQQESFFLTLLWVSWILVKSHLGHMHVGVAISPIICMFRCRICKCFWIKSVPHNLSERG